MINGFFFRVLCEEGWWVLKWTRCGFISRCFRSFPWSSTLLSRWVSLFFFFIKKKCWPDLFSGGWFSFSLEDLLRFVWRDVWRSVGCFREGRLQRCGSDFILWSDYFCLWWNGASCGSGCVFKLFNFVPNMRSGFSFFLSFCFHLVGACSPLLSNYVNWVSTAYVYSVTFTFTFHWPVMPKIVFIFLFYVVICTVIPDVAD